ncbi:transcriptional regulator, LysR family [Paramicrobacterium humi]|uniref:Transcriptional regulator, LysR family n=2 Tax=Paramicrobacterium humi TaxID=640635 RepID=A0A1H4KTE7_9MICO|nr:transcriptional regulator, LysR family [Microbacterium humi]
MFIMRDMNSNDLRRVDLNLLVVFQTIMREGSVTRAAVKLNLSQSAVSAALARLRVLFTDPLFERSRAGMLPTARALELSALLAPTLTAIANVVFESPSFDPTQSTRVIHLAMSDDLAMVLAPWLARRKLDEGWSIDFGIHQTNSTLWRDSIDDPRNEVVLTVTPERQSSAVRSAPLFSGGYRCVYNAQLLKASSPITYSEYVAANHVRVSYDVQRGWVDELLAADGHKRRTLCAISHFSGLAPVINRVPAIATIPSHAAHAIQELCGLTVSPVPLPAPRFTISALWRTEVDGAPENVWLRGLLSDFAEAM